MSKKVCCWEMNSEWLGASSGSDADDARQAVLSHLTVMLRLLNENERLALVDELLLASSLPE